MSTKHLDLTELRKSDREVAPDRVGTLQTAREEEVAGRAVYQRYGQCSTCGFIGVYNYDTNAYHAYRCSSCGTVLVS